MNDSNDVNRVFKVTAISIVMTFGISVTRANAELQKGRDEAKQARQFESKGDHVNALKMWDVVVAKNSDAEWWRRERATTYIEVKNYKRALQDFDYILKSEPRDIFTMQDRVKCLGLMKNYQAAIEAADEILKINPAAGQILGHRTDFLEKVGRHKEAQADRDVALKYGLTAQTDKVLMASTTHYAMQHLDWCLNMLRRQI